MAGQLAPASVRAAAYRPGAAGAQRRAMGVGVTLGLLLAVLVLHLLSLDWLGEQVGSGPGGLARMATPMLTRQITVQAPSAAPTRVLETKRPAARVSRSQKAIKNVAKNDKPNAANPPNELLPSKPPDTSDTLAQSAVAALPSISMPEPPAPEPTAPVPEPLALTPEASTSAPTSTAVSSVAATATLTVGRAATVSSIDPDRLSRWPLDTRLSYALSGTFRGPLTGTGSVVWQRQGDRYQTTVDLDLGFLRIYHMLSQGRVSEQGLAPSAFEEKRTNGKLRVVRLGETAVTLDNGHQIPRPEGLQDTASQFVDLTYRFNQGSKKLAVGEVLRYPLARPGGVDEWVFDVVAEDTLQTARWGPVKAFHIKPRPLVNPRGQVYPEIWFAPSLQYMPARIRITEGEAVIDLLVTGIEQAEPAPSVGQTDTRTTP